MAQPGRPVIAYLCATALVGIALGLVWSAAFRVWNDADPLLSAASMFAMTIGATVVLPALPSLIALRMIRRRGWPRGLADALAGAVIALLLSTLVFLYFEGVHADFKTPVRVRAVAGVLGFWLAPNAIAGAVAGWLYWRFAGSPRV